MKKFLTLAALISLSVCINAQNSSPYWSLAGNSNATSTSKLGTTNATSLRIVTNNLDRMRVTSSGLVGIGTTAPNAKMHINSASTEDPLRVQVNAATKLLVHKNGGAAIGGSITPPANGLYVSGNVGMGTSSPSTRLEVKRSDGQPLIAKFTNSATTGEGTALVDIQNGQGELWRYGVGGLGNAMGLSFGQFYIERAGAGSLLTINRHGNVGIGTNNPSYKLEVVSTDAKSDGVRGGVRAYANASNNNGIVMSIFGFVSSDAGAGEIRGVSGLAEGGSVAYGVYGKASGASNFNAAGYFAGTVYSNDNLLTSDRKFKEGISPLEHTLQQVMKLRPSAYRFKTTEYARMHLPKGKQIGLIADEVKEVFPELVKEGVHPAEYDKDNKTKLAAEISYEAINYQGLIPVLVASIQELNKKNEELANENKQLKQRLDKIEDAITPTNSNTPLTLSSAYLEQSAPNPVNGSALIRYHIPSNVNATLVVTNMKGVTVKTVALATRTNQVTIDSYALATGTYTYSLAINGQQVDSKQMVVVR